MAPHRPDGFGFSTVFSSPPVRAPAQHGRCARSGRPTVGATIRKLPPTTGLYAYRAAIVMSNCGATTISMTSLLFSTTTSGRAACGVAARSSCTARGRILRRPPAASRSSRAICASFCQGFRRRRCWWWRSRACLAFDQGNATGRHPVAFPRGIGRNKPVPIPREALSGRSADRKRPPASSTWRRSFD